MNTSHFRSLCLTLVTACICLTTVVTVSAEPNYAWVQTDVLVLDQKESWAKRNSKDKNWQVSIGCSATPRRIMNSVKYIGPPNQSSDPPKRKNETLAVEATWSAPPRTIQPDTDVTLNLKLKVAKNTQSWHGHQATILAQLTNVNRDGRPSGERSKFHLPNNPEKSSFFVQPSTKYKPIDVDVVSFFPKGREGDQVAIVVNSGVFAPKPAVAYIYTNKEVSGNSKSTSSGAEFSPTPLSQVDFNSAWRVKGTKNGDFSRILWRFSSQGTVNADGAWSGRWERIGNNQIRVTIIDKDAKTDEFEVTFYRQGTEFVAFKNGRQYRFGQKR